MFNREFQKNFNGDKWGFNGPKLLTRVLQQFCNTNAIEEMTPARCHEFNILPTSTFYAIQWQNWLDFFEYHYTTDVMNLTEQSIAVHLWNKYSHEILFEVGTNVAYGLIAEQYCPQVYRSCGEYF